MEKMDIKYVGNLFPTYKPTQTTATLEDLEVIYINL